MMLQSVIDRKVQDRFAADLSISGQHMDAQSANFTELVPPLGDYEMRSRVAIKEGQTIFPNLEVRIGSSHLSGNIEIHSRGEGHRFDIRLNSPFLETSDLVHWVEDWRSTRQDVSGQNTNEPNDENNDVGILTLIDQNIDEITEDDAFDITLEIEELRSEGSLLGKARFGLVMDDKELRLQP